MSGVESQRRRLVESLAAHAGIPLEEFEPIEHEYEQQVRDKKDELAINDQGKYRVIGTQTVTDNEGMVLEKFWIAEEFDSPLQAIDFANEKEKEALSLAMDSKDAARFYPYTPDGVYLPKESRGLVA